ncbi:MAG: 1,6-anhydro-N-acetylmuramyl-L-alanine amidase AmpD [Halioglobus sp.]
MTRSNENYKVEAGWLAEARRVPSDNFEPRPVGSQPELLVIHNISLPPGQFGGDCIERFFSNCLDWDAHPFFDEIRDVKVSSHLLIQRAGEVVQFVSFDDRAWHAGVSHYQGRDNCNDFSIGIELEGTDELPYTGQQYDTLQRVSLALFEAYPALSAQRVAGHCDIAPGRKTDPGPAFDWQRYLQPLTVNDKKEFGA